MRFRRVLFRSPRPLNTNGTAGIRISKRAQGSTRQFRPPRQRLHGIKGSVSTRHRQRFCPIFEEAIHLTKTEPQRQRSIPLSLQAVVPKTCIDIDGKNLHAMFLLMTDNLRWSVESYALRIQQRAGKKGRRRTIASV